MLFSGRLSSSPDISFLIDGVEMNYLSIRHIKLMLDEDQHDTVQVVLAGAPPRLVTQLGGSPVYMSWTVGARQHVFCGYVYATKPLGKTRRGLVNTSQIQELEVTCLGASSIMRGKKVRTWSGVTLNSLVQEMSKQYLFSYSIPKENLTLPNIVQSEKSDWEMLVQVADILGYSVNLHGTHLDIWERSKYLARRKFYCEAVSARNPTGRVYDGPGQILELHGFFEPNIVTVTSGISSDNSKTGVVGPYKRDTGSGKDVMPMYLYEKQINAVSTALAERVSRAANKHTFPYQITVTTTGICGVTPGSVMNIVDYNSYFDGLWCVTGVTQTAGKDRFVTEIKAVRDTTDEEAVNLPAGIKLGTPPNPLLRNKAWVSSKQFGETYA